MIGSLTALPRGIRSVLLSPFALALLLVQLVVAFIIYLALSLATFRYRTSLTEQIVGTVDTWWESVVSWGVFLFSLFLNGVLTYVILAILAGFLFEWIARAVLQERGVHISGEGSWTSVVRGVQRLLLVTAARILAGATALIIALGAIVFQPLIVVSFLFVGFLVGWDLVENSLAVLAPAERATVSLFSRRKAALVVFGALCSLILAVPFVGLIVVPFGVAGGAHLVADWLLHDHHSVGK
jgi:uncharacterized protein involved in cysteine biosynthesis